MNTQISPEAIEKTRAMFPAKEEARPPKAGSGNGRVDIEAYLEHYQVPYRKKANGSGVIYVLLNGCLFDSSHTKNEASIIQQADGKLLYQCFHDSCRGHTFKEARKLISGDDSLAPFMEGGQKRAEEKPRDKRAADPMACLITGAELQKLEINVEWLVPDVLPARSLTTLTGRGGIGKTTLLLVITDAVSKGELFLGRQTIKTPVYYIDFENPLPVVIDRARTLNITDVCFWLQGFESPPPRIDSDGYEAYKRLPPGLLIFDSLRASQMGDENSSRDMALAMQRYKELRDYGHTIILIHHTQKANEQGLGVPWRSSTLQTTS